jgi:hypothetical protein
MAISKRESGQRRSTGEGMLMVLWRWLVETSPTILGPALRLGAWLLAIFRLSLLVLRFAVNLPYRLNVPGYSIPCADRLG